MRRRKRLVETSHPIVLLLLLKKQEGHVLFVSFVRIEHSMYMVVWRT
jgi:hypothetical protein